MLTVLSWCFLIKGLVRFCLPQLGLRMKARVSVERSWNSKWLAFVAGLLGYGVYAG